MLCGLSKSLSYQIVAFDDFKILNILVNIKYYTNFRV